MNSMRKSILAGSWYPAKPSTLRSDILGYMNAAPDLFLDGDIVGMIAPHAGYMYSGFVAAHAYRLIRGSKYDAVILIGPSHRLSFSGVSIWPFGGYETPLGTVPIEEELARLIMKGSDLIHEEPAAHLQEHSLEIQLPFLQVALETFKLVPLVMGDQSPQTCLMLAETIFEAVQGRNVLILGSSDLSHFHDAPAAEKLDKVALKHIERNDTEGLLEGLSKEKTEACGGGPVAVTMMTANQMGAGKVRLLKYAHSGDITGDKSSVVGYAAAVCYR